MPENIKKAENQEKVIAKRSSLFRNLKNHLPRDKRKLTLLIIILSIPVTVGLALVQQEIRSRASEGDRKIFLGMALATNNNYKTDNCSSEKNCIERDLELIKSETGAYPAVYTVFANMDIDKAKTLAIFRYLDSKGISPALYLMPLSNQEKMERRDGRFILSSDTTDARPFPEKELRFNNSNPASITKIYVSVKSPNNESPAVQLMPTWKNGETIEIFGSKPNDKINYESTESFKFKIIADATVVYGHSLTINVRPIKTTPLQNMFAPGKAVFISPSNVVAKKYSNASIARGGEGSLDPNFTAYAEVIRDYGKPILLRYAHEMNGDWFLWSAGERDKILEDVTIESSSGEKLTIKGYGRRKYFDMGNTKSNYVASWKHIHGLMKQIAPNAKFFWCSIGEPDAAYFPGDDYVDYVGFDTYSGIGIKGKHDDLINRSRGPINSLMRLSSKKIIIGETGINTDPKTTPNFPTYRRNWLKDGYQALYNFSPKVAGIIYFNLDMRDKGEPSNNWLLSNAFKPIAPIPPPNLEIASVYKALLRDPRFQGKFGQQVSPPSPTPTPTPPSAAELPFGNHDSASCTKVTGWACDENNYNKPLNVKLYADGSVGEGTYLGTAVANAPREPAVGAECGGVNNHGFSFSTPTSIKDGTTHRIYAYAVDDRDPTAVSRLSSSPKVVSCAGGPPTPTPTPPDPTGCDRNVPTVTYGDTSKSGARKETLTYKITIKNNDVNCKGRRIAFDLVMPTTRWSYSPELITLAQNETKTVNFKVTSGPYASFGVKNLDLTIAGVYRPHTLFDIQTLQYNVVR